MSHPLISILAEIVHKQLVNSGQKISLAESCTGGLVSKLLTDLPGSSAYFNCGFVTYSNQAKQDILDIKPEELNQFGAVSSQIAIAMAKGACLKAKSDLAVSITGIAGPEGGTNKKPVGTVFLALVNNKGYEQYILQNFSGDRKFIRLQSAFSALTLLHDYLELNHY